MPCFPNVTRLEIRSPPQDTMINAFPWAQDPRVDARRLDWVLDVVPNLKHLSGARLGRELDCMIPNLETLECYGIVKYEIVLCFSIVVYFCAQQRHPRSRTFSHSQRIATSEILEIAYCHGM